LKNTALKIELEVDSTGRVYVAETGSAIGRVATRVDTRNELKRLEVIEFFELRYVVELNPFKAKRRISIDYNWNEYENLPFTFIPAWSPERQIHIRFEGENLPPDLKAPLSLEKWNVAFPAGDRHFLVRLSEHVINTEVVGGVPHLIFEIFEYRYLP